MSSAVFNRIGQDSTELELIQFGDNSSHTTLRDELLDGSKDYVFGCTSLSVPLHDCPIHPVVQKEMLFTIKRRYQGVSFNFAGHPEHAAFDAYKTLLKTDAAEVDFQAFVADQLPGVDAGVTAISTKAQIKTAFTARYMGIFNPGTSAPLFDPTIFDQIGERFVFSIDPGRPHFSVNDFMKTVNQFTSDVNQKLSTMGLDTAHFGAHFGANQDQDRVDAVVLNDNNVIQYLDFQIQPDTSITIKGSRDFWNCFFLDF